MARNINKKKKNNINVSYLNRDFESFRNSIVQFAQTHYKDNIRDFSESSLAGMFVDVAAYVGDVMSFYLDHQFNENSIDASFYSVLNSEYRYQFNQDIYIHSIIDFAYFENQITALKQKLYSFGIGIGIQTSAGIIKFSIANGNAENQDFNFSNTKIHISISSKF